MLNEEAKTYRWRKASDCSHGACVEILEKEQTVFLRDNKRPDLVFFLEAQDWETFKQQIKNGEFD